MKSAIGSFLGKHKAAGSLNELRRASASQNNPEVANAASKDMLKENFAENTLLNNSKQQY